MMGNCIGCPSDHVGEDVPLELPPGIESHLHFVWLGSVIGEKELAYIDIWDKTNNSRGSIASPIIDYPPSIWVDPNALLVGKTKSEITLWAEWQAMTALGLDSVEKFNRYMEGEKATDRFSYEVAKYATIKRAELAASLATQNASTHDQTRLEYIVALRGERKGDASAYATELARALEQDQKQVQASLQSGRLRDISKIFEGDEHDVMRGAYQQELNLRLNMAAASDIARVAILKREGGVYVDVDVLPRYKPEVFQHLVSGLQARGYSMPDGWSPGPPGAVPPPSGLVLAITDAIVLKLNLIPGYQDRGAYLLDSDMPEHSLAAANQKQRKILNSVIDDFFRTGKGQLDVFDPLGRIVASQGYAQVVEKRYSEGGGFDVGVPNAVLLSVKDGRIINLLYDSIERNYRFIQNTEVNNILLNVSQGDPIEGVLQELARLWTEAFGPVDAAGREGLKAIARYYQDGYVEGAKSTMWLSGPSVYVETIGSALGIAGQMNLSEIFADFSADVANLFTSDQYDSTWQVDLAMVDAWRRRQFPDAVQGDGRLAGVAGLRLPVAWATPELVDPSPSASEATDGSSRYTRQLIIQIDADTDSRIAAQRLYAKHPGLSRYAQWRADGIEFFDAAASGPATPVHEVERQFLTREEPMRITLVGHGVTLNGETRFAGDTPDMLLGRLKALIELGGYTGREPLVVNLVACNLEGGAQQAHDTFAGQVARGLGALLETAGIAPEKVDLHARYGEISVNEEGRKTKAGVRYHFENGAYVRHVNGAVVTMAPIERHIHHFLIGQSAEDSLQDYANIWKIANSEREGGGGSYDHRIWVDSSAVLAGMLAEEIELWAEFQVLRGLSREEFNRKFGTRDGAETFEAALQRVRSAKCHELADLMRDKHKMIRNHPSKADDARMYAINAMRSTRHPRSHPAYTPELQRAELEARFSAIEQGVSNGKYRDIALLLDANSDDPLTLGYWQELDLRQDLDAATNIARLLVLRQEGGVAVGAGLLPRLENGFLKALLAACHQRGLVLDEKVTAMATGQIPLEQRAVSPYLLDGLTDILIKHFDLIRDYPLREPRNLELAPSALDKSLTRTLRAAVKEVADEYLHGSSSGVFASLGGLAGPGGLNVAAVATYLDEGGTRITEIDDRIIALRKGSPAADRLHADLSAIYAVLTHREVREQLQLFDSDDRYDGGTPAAVAARQEWDLKFDALVNRLWQDVGHGPMDELLPLRLHEYMSAIVGGMHDFSDLIRSEPLSKIIEHFKRGARGDEGWRPEAFAIAEGEAFDDHNVDAAVDPARHAENWVQALRERHFPQASPMWDRPTLPVDAPGDPTSTFHYERQFIIQIDGKDDVRLAAQKLYGKHPDKSTYFQWPKDATLMPIIPATAAQPLSPDELASRLHIEGNLRISFVGHGGIQDGIAQFAARTAATFVNDLDRLLKMGLRWGEKLVINLVGCGLDDVAFQAGVSFARELANALPALLQAHDLSPSAVEVHARQGALSVLSDGRKSHRPVKYIYKDDQYVRQIPLALNKSDEENFVEDSLADRRPLHGGSPSPVDTVDGWLYKLNRYGLQPGADSAQAGLPASEMHHIVIRLGTLWNSGEEAVAMFNAAPRDSTFVDSDMEGPERTVFYDGALVVRDGLSSLAATGKPVLISVVGGAAGTEEAPLFAQRSPAALAQWLDPVLRRLGQGADQSESTAVTISLHRSRDMQYRGAHPQRFLHGLAQALQPVIANYGLYPEKLTLVAQEGHWIVTPQGQRIFMTSDGEPLAGAFGEAYQQLHEIRMTYDATSPAGFRRIGLSVAQLYEIAQVLNDVRKKGVGDLEQRALDRAAQKLSSSFGDAIGELPQKARHRGIREQMLADLNEVIRLREERNDKIASLDRPAGQDWYLAPEMVEALPGANRWRVGYVQIDEHGEYDAANPQIQWRVTEDDVYMRWLNKARSLGATLNKGVRRVGSAAGAIGAYYFAGDSEEGAAHSLTAAFMLQTLIGTEYGVFKGTDAQAIQAMIGEPVSALSPEELDRLKTKLASLRRQIAVNYAQLTSGLVGEAAELVKLVSILGSAETTARLLAKVGPGLSALGVAFDIANIVLASIDLANATTTDEKIDAGLRLGLAAVGAALDVGAVAASGVAAFQGAAAATAAEAGAVAAESSALAAAGTAATVATVLGAGGVLVTGLGFGVYVLYDAYRGLDKKVKSILRHVDDVVRDIQGDATVTSGGLLSFKESLALSSLDLRSGELVYGEVRIHAFVEHAFAVPDHSAAPEKKWLSMYDPYRDERARHNIDVSSLDGNMVVLPSALNRDYSYTLTFDPGLIGVDFSVYYSGLYDLVQKYEGELFGIHTTFLGFRYGPTDLYIGYKDTPFSLVLDRAARTLVVPSIEEAQYRGHLSYELVGSGGQYIIALPRWPIALDIKTDSDAPEERWSFDISQQIYAAGKVSKTPGEGELVRDIFKKIETTDAALRINGTTWATFSAGTPQYLTLSARLAGDDQHAVTLVIRRDIRTGQDRYVLSIPSVRDVEDSVLVALEKAARQTGIGERFLAVVDTHGDTGLLDLELHTLYASTVTDEGVDYVVNGTRELLLPGKNRLDFTAVVDGDVVKRVMMWQQDSDMRIDVTTVDDSIASVVVRTTPIILRQLMRVRDGSGLEWLTPWLRQLPETQRIFFVDGEGAMATGVRRAGDDDQFVLTQYADQINAIKISVDNPSGRATITATGVDSLTRSDLSRYADLFKRVDTIELVVSGIADRRISIDLPLDDPLFKNKRIVLVSERPVDLVLGRGEITWRTDGPDLRFDGGQKTALVWLDALGNGSEVNSIDSGSGKHPLHDGLLQLAYAPVIQAAVSTKLSVTDSAWHETPPDWGGSGGNPITDPKAAWEHHATRLVDELAIHAAMKPGIAPGAPSQRHSFASFPISLVQSNRS